MPTVHEMGSKELVAALGLVPHPEGGFFLETWRSGCAPMSTMGQTDCDAEGTVPTDRGGRRPDGRGERNALTSIYWFPTLGSPRLLLAVNLSDHVHYYHCGAPFEYTLYHPATQTLERVVLGPDVAAGQKLQVCVKGGTWKCGRLLVPQESAAAAEPGQQHCLLGEAVGPGFDFHDFTWVQAEQVVALGDADARATLTPYVHERIAELGGDAAATVKDAEGHYAEDVAEESKRRLA